MTDATEDTVNATQLPEQALGVDETVASAGGPQPEARRPADVVPERGALIARYVVLSRLGAGAMGVVLAAYDPELDRRVALKLLKARPTPDGEAARARLQREAQALAKLNHTNVVAVHDVGVHDGQVFIAMEFVDGQTLGRWMGSAPGDRPRPWREVVAMFGAAGRGLAAAHERGLIHRDFKPDNVMIGDDGRIRVMDFGLARAGEERFADPLDLEGVDAHASSSFDTPLTQTGAVMGTPAYMAPEQFTGGEVTAQSDQFAFCVALFEALFGVRPFDGDTLAQLAFVVTEGKAVNPPRGVSAPGWLLEIVRRGLSRERTRRFASMRALLAAMGAGAARRRRNTALAVVAALGVTIAGGFGYQRWDEQRRVSECTADGARIDEVWNDETRSGVRDGLLATGATNAEATVERSIPYLDAHSDALRTAQVEACLDARVRDTWSEDLLDRATWCLDERRMRLGALATEFSNADLASVQKAVNAAARLPRPDSCRDERRLQQSPPPPTDREAVQAVRRSLSTAGARSSTGKARSSLDVAKDALAAAERIGWPALTTSARLRVGTMLLRTGESEAAESELEQAYFEAAAAGLTETVADVATELAYAVGYQDARTDDGRRWGRHAAVALAVLQASDDSLQRAQLDNNLAAIAQRSGDHESAKRHHQRALEARERVLGPSHPSVAYSIDGLANSHNRAGEYGEAKALYGRALAIQKDVLGPDHPAVAHSLSNLGGALHATGEYIEAASVLERALAIREDSLPPDHPDLALALNNLAGVRHANGEFEEAAALFRRALAIREQVHGPDHPAVASTLNNLAVLQSSLGEFADAKALCKRALAIHETVSGPEHRNVALSLYNLAEAELATGALDEAEASLVRALAIWEKVLGPEHIELAYALHGLAKVATERGRPADAIAPAERALTLRTSEAAPAALVADTRFVLARSLWDAPAGAGRDRARARHLAEEARDGSTGDSLVRIEEWLAERP